MRSAARTYTVTSAARPPCSEESTCSAPPTQREYSRWSDRASRVARDVGRSSAPSGVLASGSRWRRWWSARPWRSGHDVEGAGGAGPARRRSRGAALLARVCFVPAQFARGGPDPELRVYGRGDAGVQHLRHADLHGDADLRVGTLLLSVRAGLQARHIAELW